MNRKDNKIIESQYCKEELPTFHELYNDFYKSFIVDGNPIESDVDKNTALDAYWKVPKKDIILGTTCNWLNKQIQENDIIIPALNHMSQRLEKNIYDAFFSITDITMSDILYVTGGDFKVPIFNILKKDGSKSIFTTDYPRLNINKWKGRNKLSLFIINSDININRNGTFLFYEEINDRSLFIEFITILLKDVIEYYENKMI